MDSVDGSDSYDLARYEVEDHLALCKKTPPQSVASTTPTPSLSPQTQIQCTPQADLVSTGVEMEGIDRSPEEEMAFRSFLVPNNQLSPVAEIDENSRSQGTFSTRATGTISCKRSLYRQSTTNESLFDDIDQIASDWKLDVRNYVAHLESSSSAEEVAEIRKLSEEVLSDPSDPSRWLKFLRLRAHGTADTAQVLRAAESNHNLIPSANVMYLWAMKLSLPSASSDSFNALVHDYNQVQTESFLSVAYNLLDQSVRTRQY